MDTKSCGVFKKRRKFQTLIYPLNVGVCALLLIIIIGKGAKGWI